MAQNQEELNSSDNESGSEDEDVNVTSDDEESYPVISTAEYRGQSWLNRGKVLQEVSVSDNNSDSGSSDSQSEVDEADRVQNEQSKKPISASNYTSLSDSQAKKDRFWEEDPDIYGIRRSGRNRKEPVRYTIAGNQEESDDEVQYNKQLTTAHKNKKNHRQQIRRRLSSSDWPVQSSESESGESSDLYSPREGRSRPVPRPNARVPPTGQPRKAATNSRAFSLSSTIQNNKDSDEEHARISNRKTCGNVCYKEESEAEETDEDDLIEVSADAVVDYEDDDRETIEKILNTRTAPISWTGAKTTVYSSEYSEMLRQVASNPNSEETINQYLIKWKGWSQLHNTWESQETLSQQKVKGMKKLDNYMKRIEEIDKWKKHAVPEDVDYFECQEQMNFDLYEEYQQIERVIGHANVKAVDEFGNPVNQVDYLCKWQGLPYSEASWEDGPLISRIGFQAEIDSYLKRERCDKVPGRNERFPKQKPKFVPLKKQPSFIAKGSMMQLRDYQLGGLNFLSHSWSKENSVILADEMGLGKTIQSIAFLSNLINTYSVWGPFVLVVPLSTITAWQREFSLWAPEMNLVVYLGDAVSRKKIQEFEFYHSTLKNRLKFNALLTTYEIILKDKDVLKPFNWSVLLVDEAHRLKNDDSLLYKVLFDFNTHHRVLVTGTPLQNSLKELWSLLHFIMPKRFSSWEEFEENHATSEERESGFSSLHKEIEPFLFRRVKKDVEKSLPAKVEQILRVEMSSIQKQYYKWILTKNFKMLNKGMKGNSNTFLNIVMELKKCCNHAALTRPLDQADDLQAILHGSGKMMLLDKLLCRLKETGHRVLIFSQMVRMLDILADYLQRRHFAFQRLDGSIRGDVRKKALDRFNAEGSEDFCFLLSTRAGGLGINLATADTVVIFDSDWNPQNDLQAQARAHRIGQKNQVNIYRLVTKGSVEEDIVERAKKKMILDHLIIQRMDTTGRKVLSKTNTAPSTTTPFNKDELSAILKFGAEDLFKEGDGERDKELQEMDIDEILKRAETRESDDQPSTMGEELLSQFKVADFVAMDFEEEPKIEESKVKEEKSWEDIIPEAGRKNQAEEEEQEKQLQLYLPRRPRKSVKKMNIGHPSGKEENKREIKRKRKNTSSSGDEFDGDGKSKKKRGRPRTVKREDIEGFSDQEIRRFVKSYKKFARPLTRLDSIAIDAELEDKSKEGLAKLANALHDGCVKEVKDYDEKLNQDPNFDGKKRGASLRLSGVSVNAPSLLKHEAELEPLADAMPADPEARKKYRFTTPAKSVHWDVEWEVTDDSMLVVGIYEHGLGSWETIKADPKLALSKILPPGNLKPQDKHLQTRAEYLVRLLKQDGIRSKAETLRQSSEKLKIKIKKLEKMETGKKKEEVKKKEKKKKPKIARKATSEEQPSSLEKAIPPVTSPQESEKDKQEIIQEQPKNEKTEEMTKKPKKKVVEKGNTVKLSVKKGHEVEENKGAGDLPMHVMADMDQATFAACKEKMRPVKRSLKLLENPGSTLTESQHVEQTRQCLLKIGDHIMNTTSNKEEPEAASDWRSTLWSFVANFTAFDAKKLYKLYKHACKKRDKKKKEGKTKKDSSKTPKSSSQKRPNETGAGHHGDKQARLSGNAGTHGSSAHSSRPSKDHHENSWRGSNRDNTKDSYGNRSTWRNDQHYNEYRSGGTGGSSHHDQHPYEKSTRREDPKSHRQDDGFRSRTNEYRDHRTYHNPKPPSQQQQFQKADPRGIKSYRDLDRPEASIVNKSDHRTDTEHDSK